MGAVESLMMDDHTGSPNGVLEKAQEIVAKATENYIGSHPEIRLTNEERLEVENLSLRIQLVASTRANYVQEVNKTLESMDGQLGELRVQVTAMQKDLQEKYGIDFTRQQIQAGTGRIIPAPSKT